MEPDCVNLTERFGERYRITIDEADDRKRRETVDPWLVQIPCERGVIFPHGGTTLAVEVDRRPVTVSKLRTLPCCRQYQAGDHETTFLFDVADFDAVAAVVLPRRRRQVSEAERARLVSIGFKTKALSGHSQAP